MFSKLFSLFSRKRTFSSTEEMNKSVDEGSERPTKRVRMEEPSSNNENSTEQLTPAQATCTNNDEEREVLEEILPQGRESQEEMLAIGAGLREEVVNHSDEVQDLLEDAEVERILWEAAMADAREERRRQTMEALWRDQERVHEERRRQRVAFLEQPPQDEPMGVIEGRFMAPLPVRRAVPMSSFTPSSSRPATLISFDPLPSFGIPLISQSHPSRSTPRELSPWVFGSKPSPTEPFIHIFTQPPPAQTRRSSSNRGPACSPPTAVDESSAETILASIRRVREQFSGAGEDERVEDDDESGDEDLPLFTAMMQAGNSAAPNPEYHRDYPVYAEELDLLEDEPQVMVPDTPLIIVEPRVRPVVEDDDEETEEERLTRLVREGEAEDGVDLE